MDSGLSIINPNNSNAVSVSALEWRLIGRRLLSDMSGGDDPTGPRNESQTAFSGISYQTTLKDVDAPREGVDEEGPERRKLKNEDSSYDSDFDPSESVTSPREDAHEDVSRTVSETLAAEFEDYVTHFPGHIALRSALTVLPPKIGLTRTSSSTQSNQSLGSPAFSSSSSTAPSALSSKPTATSFSISEADASTLSLASVVGSEEYPQQVEFGVKLGYRESLVQLALAKLGLNPDKNELLNELIRLGAGAPRSDCDEDTAEEENEQPILRQIIIDGSNVAMSHGNKVKFSCKGIRLCVEWFRARGHKEILVFVPMFRKEQSRMDAVITDRDVLQELEKEGVISFTPSRSCGGKRIVSYDDRYIIKEALKSDGIIVSNDNYRDLQNESPAFRKVIKTSLLMYSWVNGRFEPPDDPLGRNGPSLDAFLRKLPSGVTPSHCAKDSRPCPYGRKCTYGNKCKYVHPERGAAPVKSVTEILHEQKQKHYQDKAKSRDSSPGENLRAKSLSLPISSSDSGAAKKPLSRTQSTFPSISSSYTPAMKEGTTPLEFSGLCYSETKKSPVHTPVTSQASLESMRGTLIKSDSSSLFSICPSQLGYGSNISWPTQDTTQPNQTPNVQMSYDSHVTDQLESLGVENLHKKLQRQLSLNPGGDDRLNRMSKQLMGNRSTDYGNLLSSLSLHQQHQHQQQNQLHQQLLHTPSSQHQTQHRQHSPQSQHRRLLETDAMANRSAIGNRCISPGPAFPTGLGAMEMLQPYYHPPLSRHSSSQEGTKTLLSFPQQMLPAGFHNPVGRNLSAPDQIRGGSQQQPKNLIPHITRLNSTSDSSLNIHVSNDPQQFASECFDDTSRLRLPYSNMSLPAPVGSNAPGPIGSRPISPQQTMSFAQTSSLALQHNLNSGSTSHEDERLKIFYHLSQLFPEAQVRGALAQNPEETDPTKICMSILSMSGCRSISPQQTSVGGTQLPGLVGPLPMRGSTFGASYPTSSTSLDTAREAARMEAYSKLSKLFSGDQVRDVLMRYPDETDATKLCMFLMALNCQS